MQNKKNASLLLVLSSIFPTKKIVTKRKRAKEEYGDMELAPSIFMLQS